MTADSDSDGRLRSQSKDGTQVKIASLGFMSSVLVAVVSGLFSYASSQKADDAKKKAESLTFIAGTIDTGEGPKFDRLAAGSERGLPANWRVWKKPVSFWSNPDGTKRNGFKGFDTPPEVFVNLKSLDASNLNGQGPRLSLAVPREEITRDGFQVYIYTWEDSSGKLYAPVWIEVSWFAYGAQ